MVLRKTTRMALQAAMAIAIAEAISIGFQFDRGYWITLTAMALITQTWGESLKRAFERLGMTILGGFVGTALYFFMPTHDPFLLVAIILGFVFVAVYTIKMIHLVSIFCLTGFVVFLFALIGQWNLHLLVTRIIDTALGAVIAVAVGRWLLPIKTDVNQLVVGYLQKVKSILEQVFGTEYAHSSPVSARHLSADFRKIRRASLSIRYELLFHQLSAHNFYKLLNHLALCTRYMASLVESHHQLWPCLSQEEQVLLQQAVRTTEQNLQCLIDYLQYGKPPSLLAASDVSVLLGQAIADNPARFASLASDALGVFSLMYFFTRFNSSLNQVYALFCR